MTFGVKFFGVKSMLVGAPLLCLYCLNKYSCHGFYITICDKKWFHNFHPCSGLFNIWVSPTGIVMSWNWLETHLELTAAIEGWRSKKNWIIRSSSDLGSSFSRKTIFMISFSSIDRLRQRHLPWFISQNLLSIFLLFYALQIRWRDDGRAEF